MDIVPCTEKFEDFLKWIPAHLMKKHDCTKKIIIYVRSINTCHQIFTWLLDEIGDLAFCAKNSVIEMFHAGTDKESKARIIEQFVRNSGNLKVLIATMAFGMGVNIPDIDIVVHWGLPASSLSYWQEVGRCARDGRQGYAICYAFKRSVTRCQDDMLKKAVDGKCARVTILEKFVLKGVLTSELNALQIIDTLCSHESCKIICDCLKCKCCSKCRSTCVCDKSKDMFERFIEDSNTFT